MRSAYEVKEITAYIYACRVKRVNTHFYMSVKRKDLLKDFCDFVNITYKRILGHVETRCLGLLFVFWRFGQH